MSSVGIKPDKRRTSKLYGLHCVIKVWLLTVIYSHKKMCVDLFVFETQIGDTVMLF